MTLLHGPELSLQIGQNVPGTYLAVEGLRLSRFTIKNDFVDDTNAGDGGWRSILSEAGQRTLSLGVKGLSLGSDAEVRLRALALSGETTAVRASIQNGWALSACFAVASLQYDGLWNDEPVFAVEFESAGAIVIA